MKKLLIIILLLSLPFIIGSLLIIQSVLVQEGNPLPIIKAMVYIPFSENGFSKYGERKYVTNIEGSYERLMIFMKNRGYTFVEQMGSGYFFQDKTGKRVGVEGRMFSRFFKVYYLGE